MRPVTPPKARESCLTLLPDGVEHAVTNGDVVAAFAELYAALFECDGRRAAAVAANDITQGE